VEGTMVFEKIHAGSEGEFEQIVYCSDSRVGLKAIIGIHSTVLGPATGGCRMWKYESEQDALTDVLRLSKGMTYKASISGLNWGGGKAVIIGDSKKDKSPALLERYAEFVDRLGGTYITAKDVGIGSDDLKIVKGRTRHVLGIEGVEGSSGDPSPATAWGVYHGMLATARHSLGATSLKGLTIALQGLGSVAYYLMEHLKKDGATVVGCDVDQTVIDRAVKTYGIEIVKPEAIFDVACDIFAPSALGGAINRDTVDRLKTRIVAGAANNQLKTSEDGAALMKRGISYAPDYAINAGGLINIYDETLPGGYNRTRAFNTVSRIEQTIAEILRRSDAERLQPQQIADKIAEERIRKAQ
jgi:leucine dehydrogenase